LLAATSRDGRATRPVVAVVPEPIVVLVEPVVELDAWVTTTVPCMKLCTEQ